MIGETIHHYHIVSQLGEGGMGIVYLAEHVNLSKRVAVKVLSKALSGDPQFRSRFYGEAQKQASLDHPNIVQATDFFEANGQFVLVMEYVDGPDLSKHIKAKGKLPEEEALSFVQDILRGLAFAHRKGLVHRDIKPSNVLIDAENRARIMDFGIAILARAGEKRLTATGGPIGSPWYMSPEQIQNAKQLDHRSDIYSVGIVLYEMLAGDVPFDGQTDYAIYSQHIESPPPDLRDKRPDLSEELVEIVRKALAKEPAERFQDCLEFRKRIEEYARRKDPPPQPTGGGGSIYKWVAAACVMLLLSLGAFLMAPINNPPVPPPQPSTVPPPQPSTEEGEKTDIQREKAYNLIEMASVKASVICRDFEALKRRRGGLESVRQIDLSPTDTASIEDIKKQIKDLEKNIHEAVPQYGEFINRLATLDSEIVDAETNHYFADLTNRSAFEQIRMIRMTKKHHERYRAGKTDLDVKVLRRDCEQDS